MLICDDRRDCVDVNVAACLFLRSPRETLLRSRIDDLVPPESRPGIEARWERFQEDASPSQLSRAPDELVMPDGVVVEATLSVRALGAHRHLVVIDFPPARAVAGDVRSTAGRALTARERQVLTRVAEGETGARIAAELYLSPATVQSHVNSALLKLNAKNRAHGISIAMRSGEIDPA